MLRNVLALALLLADVANVGSAQTIGVDIGIRTTVGTVYGLVNSTTPDVTQFLGVPYANPPIGTLRWTTPTAKTPVDRITATSFGASCPQFSSVNPSTYSQDAPQFLISGPTSEDCLTLNIWSPRRSGQAKATATLLPVIIWIYGGGFQTGGGQIEYQIPSQWIQRSQQHIVVGINYRLNIFGFPNAKGLNGNNLNLGLLDQRLGVEWVRNNIAAFGGDPSRIVLWGQSAGAESVDFYNFAHTDDPIVSGLIMDSGTALLPNNVVTATQSNFSFVASQVGCPDLAPGAELDCMRNVSYTAIEAFLERYQDNGTLPAITFNPTIDNQIVFANYTDRALAGNFTHMPAIMGTNANEGTSLVAFHPDGENIMAAQAVTFGGFWCPADTTTRSRYAVGIETFRYLYSGNFSNIAPRSWEGAYHSSELPLIFGTDSIVRGQSSAFETAVSHRMQDLWLAFASDPAGHGLIQQGWLPYSPNGTAIQFAANGQVSQTIPISVLEGPCPL